MNARTDHRSWSEWDKQLISVGVANRVSRSQMARVFKVTRSAICGIVWRFDIENRVQASLRNRAPSFFKRSVYIRLDEGQFEEIERMRTPGQTRVDVLRNLIEWGLEAHRENR